jgi:hypothetical protein
MCHELRKEGTSRCPKATIDQFATIRLRLAGHDAPDQSMVLRRQVAIEEVTRKIWPFYALMLLVLICVTYLPEASLWLPRHVLR